MELKTINVDVAEWLRQRSAKPLVVETPTEVRILSSTQGDACHRLKLFRACSLVGESGTLIM